MCCLFGLLDPNRRLSGKQKSQILHILATAAEARGTDATGVAYSRSGDICIYKRPIPGRKLQFHMHSDTLAAMGHTRLATQGDKKFDFNAHPFIGTAGTEPFALAHNGMIYNDHELRRKLKLPRTHIETDSYIAVQLLEAEGEVNFKTLAHMAEKLEGTFTITVLDKDDSLYFVRGDNPMCICHFPSSGVYLYASTSEILADALAHMPYRLGRPAELYISCGEILKIDCNGKIERSSFDTRKLYRCYWQPYAHRFMYTEDDYIEDLKSVAGSLGYSQEYVDFLLGEGFTLAEVEEIMYDYELAGEL